MWNSKHRQVYLGHGTNGPQYEDDPNVVEWERRGYEAGVGFIAGNAIAMTVGRHYSGSGPTAFGNVGSNGWPHLRIDIGFPVGQEAQRDALAEKIRALIDAELPEPQSEGE